MQAPVSTAAPAMLNAGLYEPIESATRPVNKKIWLLFLRKWPVHSLTLSPYPGQTMGPSSFIAWVGVGLDVYVCVCVGGEVGGFSFFAV